MGFGWLMILCIVVSCLFNNDPNKQGGVCMSIDIVGIIIVFVALGLWLNDDKSQYYLDQTKLSR